MILLHQLREWITTPVIARLDQMENRLMTASSDAFAELDAQLDALTSYVTSDDTTDAAQVTARSERIKALLASVNPSDPAPAPGDSGAVEPVPADQVSPDVPVEQA